MLFPNSHSNPTSPKKPSPLAASYTSPASATSNNAPFSRPASPQPRDRDRVSPFRRHNSIRDGSPTPEPGLRSRTQSPSPAPRSPLRGQTPASPPGVAAAGSEPVMPSDVAGSSPSLASPASPIFRSGSPSAARSTTFSPGGNRAGTTSRRQTPARDTGPSAPETPRGDEDKRPGVATHDFAASSPAPASPASTLRSASPTSRSVIWSPERARTGSPSRDQTPPRDSGGPTASRGALRSRPGTPGGGGGAKADPLARLHPAQLREMRESFQSMDRDNDGVVRVDDVKEAMAEVGIEATPQSLAAFFPPNATAQTMTLSSYLHTLASLIAPLSAPADLTAAFAAFDLEDAGCIDVRELRDALLDPELVGAGAGGLSARDVDSVLGEFSGRKGFGRGGGEVFRYGEFVRAVGGGAGGDEGGRDGAVEVGG